MSERKINVLEMAFLQNLAYTVDATLNNAIPRSANRLHFSLLVWESGPGEKELHNTANCTNEENLYALRAYLKQMEASSGT
jgi:hypothetical protein